MINQQTVPSRGGVHSYGSDLAFLELEPNMSGRVFVQSQGSLEGPVSDHHGDIVDRGLVLQDVMDFIRREPGNIFSIDLQNLITKSVKFRSLCNLD